MRRSFTLGAICAAFMLTAAPLAAQNIMVHDAYIRSSTPNAPSGAAFMVLMNHSGSDDRLVGVSSDVAGKVEMHTHTEDDNGVMRMTEIDDGIAIANDAAHDFKRGGDHLMFMGLKRPLVQDEMIKVTLTFEQAGDVEIEIPVDQARKPNHGGMDHSKMDHSSHNAMHGDKAAD